jgi:hypothetical protein
VFCKITAVSVVTLPESSDLNLKIRSAGIVCYKQLIHYLMTNTERKLQGNGLSVG